MSGHQTASSTSMGREDSQDDVARTKAQPCFTPRDFDRDGWMKQEADRSRPVRRSVDSVFDFDARRPRRRSAGRGGAIRRDCESRHGSPSSEKPSSADLVAQNLDVRPASAAKGAEEVRLIGAVETQRIVARGRARTLAALASEVFVNALIDEDALSRDRSFEARARRHDHAPEVRRERCVRNRRRDKSRRSAARNSRRP